jgi:chromosome segregation ATPase
MDTQKNNKIKQDPKFNLYSKTNEDPFGVQVRFQDLVQALLVWLNNDNNLTAINVANLAAGIKEDGQKITKNLQESQKLQQEFNRYKEIANKLSAEINQQRADQELVNSTNESAKKRLSQKEEELANMMARVNEVEDKLRQSAMMLAGEKAILDALKIDINASEQKEQVTKILITKLREILDFLKAETTIFDIHFGEKDYRRFYTDADLGLDFIYSIFAQEENSGSEALKKSLREQMERRVK